MNFNQLNDLMVVNIFQQCTTRANELGAVNLAQGVPEPIMEQKLNQALASSLNCGWQYTNPWGLETLRIALANEYEQEFNPDSVLVTSGCTESLYLGLFAANKIFGNKIAFFEPSYPSYMSLATLLEMQAIPLAMNFKNGLATPNWDLVKSAMESGVKIFLLNTPHNPSGWVMSRDEAIYLRNLADKLGVLLIVDEAYRYYTYNVDNANSTVQILYKNNQNILLVGSASKLFSATGLRIGWMLGRKNILDIAYAVHLYTTYCHPTPLQQLCAMMLSNRTHNWFSSIQAHYVQKRDTLLNALNKAGFECASVAGGHFLLADYSAIRNDMSSQQFSEYFVTTRGVMPLPASPFYRKETSPRQVRFSFSVSMDTIQKAVSQLIV